MITQAGETSNLILDPDLNSYYLMDITLLALLQMQDRIADILAFLFLSDTKLNMESTAKTAVYSALLKQSDLDRVTADF